MDILDASLESGGVQPQHAFAISSTMALWDVRREAEARSEIAARALIARAESGQDVLVGARDFRFRPDSGELEPQSGPTQFGRSRDNWGIGYDSDGFSQDLKDALAPAQVLRDEQGLELFYNFVLTSWSVLGFDLQALQIAFGLLLLLLGAAGLGLFLGGLLLVGFRRSIAHNVVGNLRVDCPAG